MRRAEAKRLPYMADRRRYRKDLVRRANRGVEPAYRLRPSQWQQAIFRLRQRGEKA